MAADNRVSRSWQRAEPWQPGRVAPGLAFLAVLVPMSAGIVAASGYNPIAIVMSVFSTVLIWRATVVGVYVRHDMVKFRRVFSTRVLQWSSVDKMLARPYQTGRWPEVLQLVLVLTDGTEYRSPLLGWAAAGPPPTGMHINQDFVRPRAIFDRTLKVLARHRRAHR